MAECFDCKKLRHPAKLIGLVCQECKDSRAARKTEENYRIIESAEIQRQIRSERLKAYWANKPNEKVN